MSCPACHGTGFVILEQDGRRSARVCACRHEERLRLQREATNIPPRYQHCGLDANFEHLDPSQRWAFQLSQKLVAEYRPTLPETHRGLLFHGPCGVGKTHLAVGVLKTLVQTYQVRGIFTEFTDLVRRIQDTYDRRSETPSAAVLDPVVEADVLVLDDLGCTRMTPWMQDTVGLIVNERYNASRLTLVTTNRPLRGSRETESLADRISERVASRLLEMCRVCEIKSSDYREASAASKDFRT